MRSFDERSHTYLGYSLRLRGKIDRHGDDFLVGIGKAAQAKHEFRTGDLISGVSRAVTDSRMEPVDYYKTSRLKLLERSSDSEDYQPPPWIDLPPDLIIYRERGHRRLDPRTYEGKCTSCIWGCRIAVEVIIDQWNPGKKLHRFETFCYGPKSCKSYKAGATRKVTGRQGMKWEEEDWVDEEATSHREMDE
ncbi:hypothetical protein ACFLWS_08255 [Chloroflexota bacterium]